MGICVTRAAVVCVIIMNVLKGLNNMKAGKYYEGGRVYAYIVDGEYKTCIQFDSETQMRHHMAVLLQANRYRRDNNVPAIYRMPDPKELGRAIDFSYRYMKVFREL